MGKGIKPDSVESFDEDAAKRGGYGVVEAMGLLEMMTSG
jgi:2,3-bisphosphoglycerate-independent phosphoglycerate mutase